MAHMGQAAIGLTGVLDEAGGGDDTLLPAQFWTQTGDPRSEPEKRLMVAVVEEAMAVILNGAGSSCEERSSAVREARLWFASDDRGGLFTFASICDVLGLEPARIRQALAAWERRKHGFRRPRLQAGRGRHQVGAPRRAA